MCNVRFKVYKEARQSELMKEYSELVFQTCIEFPLIRSMPVKFCTELLGFLFTSMAFLDTDLAIGHSSGLRFFQPDL